MKLLFLIVLLFSSITLYSQQNGVIVDTIKSDGKIYMIQSKNENGELEGPTTVFFDNGKIKSVTEYKYGIKWGTFKKYNENGVIIQSGHYLNDYQNGDWFLYYETGEVWTKTLFGGGVQIGPVTVYNKKGEVISTIDK